MIVRDVFRLKLRICNPVVAFAKKLSPFLFPSILLILNREVEVQISYTATKILSIQL